MGKKVRGYEIYKKLFCSKFNVRNVKWDRLVELKLKMTVIFGFFKDFNTFRWFSRQNIFCTKIEWNSENWFCAFSLRLNYSKTWNMIKNDVKSLLFQLKQPKRENLIIDDNFFWSFFSDDPNLTVRCACNFEDFPTKFWYLVEHKHSF